MAILLNFLLPVEIKDNHLFSLFSTIAQGFITLASLLGMVGIFKLQSIHNEIDRQFDFLIRTFYGGNKPASFYPPEQVLKWAKSKIKKQNGKEPTEYSMTLEISVSKLEPLITERKKIGPSISNFVIFTLIVVFIALLSLTFTPLIIKYSLGISILGILLILSSYSLFLAIRLIKVILTDYTKNNT